MHKGKSTWRTHRQADASSEDLERKQRAQQTGADVICLIGADHTVSHGKVVSIIDLVKQEGVANFALNIDPVEEESIRMKEVGPPPSKDPQ